VTRSTDSIGIRENPLLLYLNTNPTLKFDGAIVLWRKRRIFLAKAAEIAGLTVPEFKDMLAAKEIVHETESKSTMPPLQLLRTDSVH
jgi:predicted HTH domain antitoxin